MLEWLIIGGGVHGTHLSFALTNRYGIAPDQIRVLDPFERPLENWYHVSSNVGMEYMRSPHVHNLHWDQGSLAVYARIHETQPYTRFIPPFNRPTLALFNHHSVHIIEKYGLEHLRVQGTAQQMQHLQDGWRVDTTHGALDAKRVLLAVGAPQALNIPEWAKPLQAAGAPIDHIFDREFNRQSMPAADHIAVIGGGISAAQVALSFPRETRVTLLMRHDIRVHDFDSDPGWMNKIYLSDFAKIPDPDQRRQVITAARHKGSMPPDVARDLNTALLEGRIQRVNADIRGAQIHADGIQLMLSNDRTLPVNHVLLATGYAQERPGGAWLQQLIEQFDLPTARCGYPITNKSLEWMRGLFVSGALAELEIGPAARNIIGARLASERLRNIAP